MKLPALLLAVLWSLQCLQAQTTMAQISFATNRVTVSEGDGSVTIDIRRSQVLDTAVSVRFSIAGNPKHCLPTTKVVEFAAGETNRSVQVELLDDDVVNAEEWVNLTLTRRDTNTVLGSIPSMALVIQDNDRITMGLQKYPTVWDETNGVRMLQAYRTGGLGKTSEISVTVDLPFATSPPTTFEPLTRRLTFPPGITNLDVPVVLRRDYVASPDEVLRIIVFNPDPAGFLDFQPNITIQNVDSKIDFGILPALTETNGMVDLPLFRWGPTNLMASVELVAVDDSAKAGRDYQLPARIDFAPGQREIQIPLRLFDNTEPDGTRSFRLILANPTGATSLAGPRTLNIDDDEVPPLGVSQVEVLPEFAGAGFDFWVTSLRLRPDGRLLVAGQFSKFGEVTVKSVAVVNPDGSLDTTFNPGAGPVGSVNFALPLSDSRVLVLGSFLSFAGQDRKHAARLLADGTVDPDYRLDFDTTPLVVAPTAGGGWWLGGVFRSVNGEARKWLLRLLPDGTPDPGWRGETNLNSVPLWLAPTASGQLVHTGGHIANPTGSYNRLVRIQPDGSLDLSFVPQLVSITGDLKELADGSIVAGIGQRWLNNGTYDLAFKASGMFGTVSGTMPDGSILLAGAGMDGKELRRLRMDGSGNVGDFARFDFGSLPEAVTLPDETVVVAGYFTAVNGQPRLRIARLRFPEPAAATVSWHGRRFGGEEDGSPIRVPVLRRGNLTTATTVTYVSRPLEATPGKDYESAAGSVTFAPGERLKFVELTPLADDEFEPDETLELVLSGDAVDPSFAVATVVLQSDEARVHFATAATKAVEGGTRRTILIQREGGLAYPAIVNVDRSGSATRVTFLNLPTGDYTSTDANTVEFSPGSSQSTLYLEFASTDDALLEGTETIHYKLQAPVPTPHPVRITGFAEHFVELADNDGGASGQEILGGNSGIFERVGGGLWLQNSFGLTSGFHPGPTALTADGSPDPEFVLNPDDAGFLLHPLDDGRSVVSQFVGGSQQDSTNRILRLLPGGQRDPSFTPILFQDSRTDANSYAPQYNLAISNDGSVAAVTWKPGSFPYPMQERDFVVTRFSRDRESIPLWTNADLSAATNVDISSPRRLALLPEGSFLESGSLLVMGQIRVGQAASTYKSRPLVRINPDGLVDLSYYVEVSGGGIRRLAPLPGNRCLIAGDFFRVNGHLRPGLARLLPDGSVDLTFESDLPSAVTTANKIPALAAGPNGQVWLSLIVQPDGSSRVVGLDAQGKALPGFISPVFNGQVFSIAPLTDGKVVVAGYFDLAGESVRLNYAWLDATGKVLPAAPLALNLTSSQPGSLRGRLGARFTGPVTLERSADLQSWLPVTTFNVVPGEADVDLPEPNGTPGTFYRLRRQ